MHAVHHSLELSNLRLQAHKGGSLYKGARKPIKVCVCVGWGGEGGHRNLLPASVAQKGAATRAGTHICKRMRGKGKHQLLGLNKNLHASFFDVCFPSFEVAWWYKYHCSYCAHGHMLLEGVPASPRRWRRDGTYFIQVRRASRIAFFLREGTIKRAEKLLHVQGH